MRRLLVGLVGIIGVMLVVGLLVVPRVSASTYGESDYGTCKFERRCPSQNTVIETKSGLEVAINLVDGQQIPTGGYEVKVTPLNGQGRSFERVEFYLDGVLLDTFYPDNTGTAVWLWDTDRHQGAKVKVVVYDTDGSAVTQEFAIHIVNQGAQPAGGAVATDSQGQGPEGLIGQLLAFLEATMRAMPTPIAVSLPYMLLLVLLVIILLLYAQSRREATEISRHIQAMQRARQLAEEKEGFIQLASHYLRTPLTLIRGGIDTLRGSPAVDAAYLASISAAIEGFGLMIEEILANMGNDPRLKAVPAVSRRPDSPLRIWAAPQFWIPVICIGLVLAAIDYLLVRAGKLDGSAVHLLTHVGIYCALVVALYNLVRRRQLQVRDRKRVEAQEAQQIAIDEARNNLIRDASTTLAQKLAVIQPLLAQSPDGQAKKFMQEGYARIAEVLKRFRATATVIPPVTTMPFVGFTLEALMSQAKKQIAFATQAKQVAIIDGAQNVALASPQPAWLVQILASVLDNAVAYSPPGGRVEVGGSVTNGTAAIYVRDHGQGIPAQKLSELSQPFYKAEGAVTFDHPGIGLSLYLDRLLITSLGGTMQIESTQGEGTVVRIIFPVR